MASSELSVMLTAKGNLETELRSARDRVKDLSAEIRKIQSSGGTVGDDLADEFRQATIAADKLSNKLSEVNRKVKDTARESTSAASKVGKAWMKTADVFSNNLVAGLSAGALVLFGKKAVNAFAEVQDSASALSATFGANGDALIKWAKQSGDALNLSQQEALAASQTFAGFASAAGLTGTQLETFATDLTARAADLASYYGGTTASAVEALGAALRGEAEPARRYMIMLDDMALRAEASALKIYDGNGALTAQQKILAAQSIIMKKSSQAQGDIARTADSMANQIKDSQQQMADFQATAGETIAIALNPMLKLVNGAARAFSSMSRPVQQAAIAIGLVGAAALIATPRIIAMKAHMAQAGITAAGMAGKLRGIGSFLMGPWGIAIGVATAAVMDYSRQQDEARAKVDSLTDAMRRQASEGMRPTAEALVEMFTSWSSGHGTFLEQADALGLTLDEFVTAVTEGGSALSSLESELYAAERTGGKTTGMARGLGIILRDTAKAFDKAKYEASATDKAMEALGYSTEDTAGSIAGVGDEADDAATKVSALARAMNRFTGAVGRQKALRSWRKTVKDAIAKPSADAAYEAVSSFDAAFNSFRDGSAGQARFVTKNYADMKATITKSGLSKAAQDQLLAPLTKARDEAKAVLAELKLIDSQPVSITYSSTGLPSYAQPGWVNPVRRAAGGIVVGPGTATSDSIPALLSNGEYVLRANAVRAIGLGTLNKLNHADKMTDPALLDRMAVGNTPSQASSGPLIGSIVVNNPAQNVDVERAVMRGMARAERIRKERG